MISIDLPHGGKWLAGLFDDGWLSAQAQLLVKGTRLLRIEFFLPESTTQRSKQLLIEANGIKFMHEIERGKTTNIVIDDIRIPLVRYNLYFSEAEDLRGTGENRDLGSLVVKIYLDEEAFPANLQAPLVGALA